MYRHSAQRQVRELATEIFSERRDYLMAIAKRNANSEADAEEALQEAFAAFLAHYNPSRGSPPLAWLTLTLKRRCWRANREARRERPFGGRPEHGPVLESLGSPRAGSAERLIEREEARRRIAALKPDERTALGLLAAGLSYAEIGVRKGWTYTKVNRCITEGRAALRDSKEAGERPPRGPDQDSAHHSE
jgi:DNA-directed RNA polymerase specialized sigma24 family protein